MEKIKKKFKSDILIDLPHYLVLKFDNNYSFSAIELGQNEFLVAVGFFISAEKSIPQYDILTEEEKEKINEDEAVKIACKIKDLGGK